MQWFGNLMSLFSEKIDIDVVKEKIYSDNSANPATDAELNGYLHDIQARIKMMVKDLSAIYKKHGINFSGFKSFNSACEYLEQSIHSGNEQAYNNLIKLESLVTAEQRRHLALIRMAVAANGQKVMDQINSDPDDKQTFVRIFGKSNAEGIYQQIWKELHKLSEYVLIHRNRVYH